MSRISGPGILLTKDSEIVNVLFLEAGRKGEQEKVAKAATQA